MSRTHVSPRRLSRRLVLVLPALIAACTVVLLPSHPARSSVDWRGDFETGDFSQWTWGVQEKDPSRATIVTSVNGQPPRQGRYAARFEVDPGDTNVAGSGSNGERDEALIPQDLTGGSEGNEQWWAWSTLFDPSFQANNTSWNTFTQWHNTGTSGGTTGFQVRGSELWFQVWGGDPNNATMREWKIADRTNGRWYDFVFHVKWSSDPNVGLVEVWVDGSQVVPPTHAPTLYNGQGVYLKQGYYRNAQPYVAVIYDDGMRRASSFADAVQDFPSGWNSSASTPPPPPAPSGGSGSSSSSSSSSGGSGSSSSSSSGSGSSSSPSSSSSSSSGGGSSAPSSTPPASASSPASAPAGTTSQPPGANPAGASARSVASASVNWDGVAFTAAPKLRSHLARQGLNWEAFLETHPGVGGALGLAPVSYGRDFYTRQALTRWLNAYGATYAQWRLNHPAAARRLESQPDDTRVTDALMFMHEPRLADGGVIVRAHALPGAHGRLIVQDARGRWLHAVRVVFDAAGKLTGTVRLPAVAKKPLRIALLVQYPNETRRLTAAVPSR